MKSVPDTASSDGPSRDDLPDAMDKLTEILAEKVHDAWARQRISDGWSFGPRRDDGRKQHPCLVPYQDLPDSEKEYDRVAARETIRLILAHGYRLEPPVATGANGANWLLHRMQSLEGQPAEVSELVRTWIHRQEGDSGWAASLATYRHLGRRLLKLGLPCMAREVAVAGLSLERENRAASGRDGRAATADVGLRQVLGLALARTAHPEAAKSVLGQLRDEGNRDEETLGMLARTYKDLARVATEPTLRAELLLQARLLYDDAWSRTGGIWTGINAASLATLTGDPDRARTLCVELIGLSDAELSRIPAESGDRFWVFAALGEAAVNLGRLADAERLYRSAFDAAPCAFGDHNSARRQARWLLEALGHDPAMADRWLPPPRVVVFAGHMIDRPGRTVERFPSREMERVKSLLRQELGSGGGLIGFSSAACGSDILFQEVVLELGGQTYVVLPYESDQFIANSVSIDPAGDWSRRFDAVLRNAVRTIVASPQPLAEIGVSLDYANRIIHGLALLKAREVDSAATGLAVWDGQPGDGPHGTADVVAMLRSRGMNVRVITPSTDQRHRASMPAASETNEDGADYEAGVRAMLFGDAVNFSSLTDGQVKLFVQHFLGPIAQLLQERHRSSILARNTWGDGLYLVFESVRSAGCCALDICDFVAENQRKGTWGRLGLPEELDVRLALHAGPVVRSIDPITQVVNYTGTHVSRAARLEPRTPPGQVYASEAFAALAAFEDIEAFACEYVQQLHWAKHYGTFPTYVVRRMVAAGA